MNATFLVTLSIGDDSQSSLAGYAEDIRESCETEGLPVVSVAPWARPSVDPPTADPLAATQRLF